MIQSNSIQLLSNRQCCCHQFIGSSSIASMQLKRRRRRRHLIGSKMQDTCCCIGSRVAYAYQPKFWLNWEAANLRKQMRDLSSLSLSASFFVPLNLERLKTRLADDEFDSQIGATAISLFSTRSFVCISNVNFLSRWPNLQFAR